MRKKETAAVETRTTSANEQMAKSIISIMDSIARSIVGASRPGNPAKQATIDQLLGFVSDSSYEVNASGSRHASHGGASALNYKANAYSEIRLVDEDTWYELGLSFTRLREAIDNKTDIEPWFDNKYLASILYWLHNKVGNIIPGNPVWDALSMMVESLELVDASLVSHIGGKEEAINATSGTFSVTGAVERAVERAEDSDKTAAICYKAINGAEFLRCCIVQQIESFATEEEERRIAKAKEEAGKIFQIKCGDWHSQIADGIAKHKSIGGEIPHKNPEFTVTEEVKALWKGLVFQAIMMGGRPSNVLLTGPAGTGKTTIAREFAAWLGLPFYIVEAYEHRYASAFYGRVHIIDGQTVFVDSVYARALEAGNCVIDIDEITRCEPSASNAFLPILDWRRCAMIDEAGKKYTVGPNTFFFASANIGSGFSGTHKFDQAVESRFDVRLDIDVPDEAGVMTMFRNSMKSQKRPKASTPEWLQDMEGFEPHGMNETDAHTMTQWVCSVNKAVYGGQSQLTRLITPRDVEAMAKWFQLCGWRGLRWAVVNKYTKNLVQDQRNEVVGKLQNATSDKRSLLL